MSVSESPQEAASEGRLAIGGIVQHGLISTEAGNVPVFIVNGLGFVVSQTEMTLMLMFANRPSAAVIMAPAMAKTLGESLLKLVAEYETKTGQVVKSSSDLQPA